VAPVSGPLAVLWRLHKVDDQGSGVTGLVLHNGLVVDSVVLDGADKVGVARLVRLAQVQAGDTLDFALSPAGADGLVQEGGDSSDLQATLWLVPDLSAEISTDLADTMPGVSSALRLRCPLVLPEDVTLTALTLHLRADDGAVVWLDGQQVAALNGPADATWTQAEAPLLTDADAEQWQQLDLTSALAGWGNGPHVLALRGVNASANDSDFLLAAELTGEARVWHWDQPHYFTTPTPGGPNVDGSPHLGPLLHDLTPTNAVTIGQPLKVQIRAVQTTAAVAGVVLKWRLGYGNEQVVTLVDDGTNGDVLAGDGIYTTSLVTAGLATGQMIRWAAIGTDAVGKQSRLPAFADPDDTEAYHGTVLSTVAAMSQLPVLQLFVESLSASYTQIGTHGSLWYNGEFYDNVRIDLHGQSTQGFPKKSWDIDFPRDHRFLWRADLPRYKDINLLSNYADKSKLRNTLAYEIHQAAGTDWHLAEPVRVLLGGKFWGLFDLVEDGDGRWLQRLGRDPDGALYKVNDGLYSASLAEKKTREQEDKSDLADLIAALQLPAQERRLWLLDHVNLPAMVGFVASYDLTGNRDCCHKNFYAYRDTRGSGQWWLMPWDVDLTLGRNWSDTKGYLDDTLDAGGGLRVGANNNALLAALFALPEFDAMYLRRLRTLMDTVLQPPETDPQALWLEGRLDVWQALVATEAAADATKWPTWGTAQTAAVATAAIQSDYLTPRRDFLYGPQLVSNGGKVPLPAADVQLAVGQSSLSGEPDEWLALSNLGSDAVDLSGATLAGPRIATFAPGTVLPAGMTVYLTPDLVAFRARSVSPKGGEGLWALGGVFAGPSNAPWQVNWPGGQVLAVAASQ
jgi:hypothetical protein